jgi:hypothetical protein
VRKEECDSYVGFLRADAVCQNCGAPCCEHELSLAEYVRLEPWDDAP